MTDSIFYSFDDTDALLASLSNSSIPTLSPSDLDGSSSSAKTSSYGEVSPEETFFQDDEWSRFDSSNNVAGVYSGNDFTGFNIDDSTLSKTTDIEEQEKLYISPSISEISPLDALTETSNPELGVKIKTEEDDDDDEDDEDDILQDSGRHMKKEHSTSTVSNASKSKVSKPKKDRSSHNIIEKKYRTNINTKITSLRNAVPTLRIAAGDPSTTMNDLEGLSPPSKVNKASVLTKATEYIKHLERKNANLLSENQHLRHIIESLSPQIQQQIQQQAYPQFSVNQPQHSGPIPQQAPPPPPPHVPVFNQGAQFQPATNMNGQPLNIVSQQPQPQPYQMGVPGKILMGGLTTLVGANLFNNGGNDYDYRGLSAFPILSTPQFQIFMNITRFLFISLSLLYIFIPSIFQSIEASNDGNVDQKEQSSRVLAHADKLSNWYQLIKELVFIHVGDQKKTVANDSEVLHLINKEIFTPRNDRTFLSYLFVLMKLNTYQPTFEVSFGKAIISKLLLTYSDLSSSFNILNTIIQNSLIEISHQKVTDTNLRYLYKEFKHGTNEGSEAFKRILNLSLGLDLSHNCEKGVNDKGYELILHDERVTFDHKQLLSSIRANELFREVLLEYIDLTFSDSSVSKLGNDELKETKKELWNKLSLAENLAPKRSIVDIRVKLLKSILNEKYLDSTLKLINEESKALRIKEKLNGAKESDDKSSLAESQSTKEEDETHEIKSVSESNDSEIYESEEVEEDDEEGEEEEEEDDDQLPLDGATIGTDRSNKSSHLDPRFQKLLSQDLFNALVSSTILKYSRSNHRLETSKLLKYIHLNRNEFSLLSFISMFKLVQKFPKNWMVYSSSDDSEGEMKSMKNSQFDGDFEIIENIVCNLRLWIGDSNNLNFKDYENDGLQLKREISDKLVEVGKSFGYYG